jgi:hypothetical protein
MTIMAVILFEERIAFLDGAFILFSILSEGELAIQVYRFGAAVTQAVPLLASWMDFSLESIMKIYSACFPIYFYSLFLICLLGLKKEWYAILLLLFNVGIVTHTFYWVIPEFQQGLSLMVVYFAFLEKAMEQKWFSNSKIWTHSINTGLICTLAFFHPLMIFPFAFFIGYFFLFSKNSPKNFHWLTIKNLFKPISPIVQQWQLSLSGSLFLFFFLLKSLVFNNAYDNMSIGGLRNFKTLFPDYFTIQSNLNFLSYLVVDYYLLIVALIAIGVYAVTKKKFIWLSFILIPFLGYLFLINISYPKGPHQFYIESLYLPLSLILFLPVIYTLSQKLNSKTVLLALSIIVSIRMVHIYQTHSLYSERVAYVRDFLDKTKNLPNKKLILRPEQVNDTKLFLDWGLAYEAWLLSTIDKGISRSAVVEYEAGSHQSLLKENKVFAATWGIYPYENLSNRYFMFKDSSYYVIPEGDFNFK